MDVKVIKAGPQAVVIGLPQQGPGGPPGPVDTTTAAALAAHAADHGNPHAVTKAQVGLGSVNNTADADKPVSTATQNALNAKASTAALAAHASDTANPHNVTKSQVGLGNVDNTPDADKPVSAATQAALDTKADIESPALTGVPTTPRTVEGTHNTIANAETVYAASRAVIGFTRASGLILLNPFMVDGYVTVSDQNYAYGYEFTDAATLAAAINSYFNGDVVTAEYSGNIISLTAVAFGTVGNEVILTGSGDLSVSGSGTLEGGVDVSGDRDTLLKLSDLIDGKLDNGADIGSLSGILATSKGGLGANNSAASGVPLFASGVNTFTGTNGTGNFVRTTSPSLVTPALGAATGASVHVTGQMRANTGGATCLFGGLPTGLSVYGGFWVGTTSPTDTNYSLLAGNSQTLFNATNQIEFRIGNLGKMVIWSTGGISIGVNTDPGAGNLRVNGSMASASVSTGAFTGTGQAELTGQAATNGTSAITRDLMDARLVDPDLWIVNENTIFANRGHGWRPDDRSNGAPLAASSAPGICGVVMFGYAVNQNFGLQYTYGAVSNSGPVAVPKVAKVGSYFFYRFSLGDITNLTAASIYRAGWIFFQMEVSTGKIAMDSYTFTSPWATMNALPAAGNFQTGVYYEVTIRQLTSSTISMVIDEVSATTGAKTNRLTTTGSYSGTNLAPLTGNIGGAATSYATLSNLFLHQLIVRIPK